MIMANVDNAKESSETVHKFQEYDDSADVVIVIGNKKLYCHSMFLKRISAKFCNMVKMARNESTEVTQVEIKMDDDVSYSNFISILKFYYPNHRFEASGQEVDVLVCLFETCHRFDCKKMKYVIYDYLDKGNRLTKYFKPLTLKASFPSRFIKIAMIVASPEMKKMITRPDLLSTIVVCHRMYNFSRLAVRNMNRDIKFELLIWMYVELYKQKENEHADCKHIEELIDVETAAITSFFKIYFYENRSVDLSVSRKSKNEEILRYFPEFLSISPPGDCNIVGEDHTFAVSSVALSISSPVFKAMLTSSFREGAEKMVTLPGKKLEDIIELMNHLHHPMEIDEKSNILGLLPLCREYQIDWLTEKIKNFVVSSLSSSTELSTLLNYLYIAENYGFQRLKDKIFKIPCSLKFIHLQMMEEFNNLSKETQVEFVCKTVIDDTVYLNFGVCLLFLLEEQHSTKDTSELQCSGKRKRGSVKEEGIDLS